MKKYSEEFAKASKALGLELWEMESRSKMGVESPKKMSVPEGPSKEESKKWKIITKQGFGYVVKPGEELVYEEGIWSVKPVK